jgi:hypothetical protein
MRRVTRSPREQGHLRGREVERDPRGAGPAEGVRQPRLRGHHDRRNAHAHRHRAGHPRPASRSRAIRSGRYNCFRRYERLCRVPGDLGKEIKQVLAAGSRRAWELPSFRPGPARHPQTRRTHQPLLRIPRPQPHFTTLPFPWGTAAQTRGSSIREEHRLIRAYGR